MNYERAPMESRLSQWSNLRKEILACSDCNIRQEAIKPVPGVGTLGTGILFLGRNPGKTEDLNGEPFIGPAGKILNQLFLPACRLARKDIFLTNIVLCHTYQDEEPSLDCVRICMRKHLYNLLPVLAPYLIVTFGALAAFTLVGYISITKEHGKLYRNKRGFYIIPAYHPGSALYNPNLKEAIKHDAAKVGAFLAEKDKYVAQLNEWLAEEKKSAIQE